MKTLILVDDGFEDLTLFLPWYRLREAGVGVRLACPLMHAVTGAHGYAVEPDFAIHEVNPAEYDLLLIPHGSAVERLRQREEAVDVTRTFIEDGKLVAAIGHGAQLLISAGTLDGRRVTCSPGIRDDVRAAGALYRDDAVVTDGNLLTCRGADDLPAFSQAMMKLLAAPQRIKVEG
ncbi:peptidase : Intracellular protease, PfpI family OS=Methanohalobium evestigatum (strain DSM 3721 / OCM 161 / Z-7303) GN=Metev_0694 PE=4 SV=1: DJ-1_PfpI [Gemmata massiliana]|uniref:DJ-1/PfpI domain-containing protein n=1 Tax=Gemmata massiliana TaxID=1210884 RepID=A0A6P2DLW5_9BACT|nr:type 1 glutamine amidotransferase domain-containing protein [Gemmata massiliana]VTS02787.1 peptidase : Intracellular protease, PfpI family OS=Methanohalobium evestigatum (strain DSM 3721 / OCM 161 / Z-7303) GN=Metev_0694 PE=4 SV=1: DJ-1_PfpI [Gemmata massiliana]